MPARSCSMLLFEPFTLAVNLETGAIDEQMRRFAPRNWFRQECQAITTTAEMGWTAHGVSVPRCASSPAVQRSLLR
jgi:hypothetical protein